MWAQVTVVDVLVGESPVLAREVPARGYALH
jgi:hypothetical protein